MFIHYITSSRTPRISGLKSQVLKPTFLSLKIYGKKWSRIFYFEILLTPSELPANLPGQFSFSGKKIFRWAAATLKGLVEFQNKRKSRPLFPIISTQKCWFQDLRFQSTYSSSSRWCEHWITEVGARVFDLFPSLRSLRCQQENRSAPVQVKNNLLL